jgi:hypothetical protein
MELAFATGVSSRPMKDRIIVYRAYCVISEPSVRKARTLEPIPQKASRRGILLEGECRFHLRD